MWIEKKITEILSFEDEFLVNYIISLLENPLEELDPRKIQVLLTGIKILYHIIKNKTIFFLYQILLLMINLLGFLDNEAVGFMKDLWKLLISAQNSPNGIPDEIIKEKEDDLKKQVENKSEKIKFLEKMIGDKKTKENKEELVIEKKYQRNSNERNKKKTEKKRRHSRSRSASSRSRSRSRKRHRKDH